MSLKKKSCIVSVVFTSIGAEMALVEESSYFAKPCRHAMCPHVCTCKLGSKASELRSSVFNTTLAKWVKPVDYRQHWPTAIPIMSHTDGSKFLCTEAWRVQCIKLRGRFITTPGSRPCIWTTRPSWWAAGLLKGVRRGSGLTFNCLSDYCPPRAIALDSNTTIMSDY